jgi:integrase
MAERQRVSAPFAWDKGVEYEVLESMLRRLLETARSDRDYLYAAILYVQLKNASRVSEAVDAVLEFARAGEREVYVRVRKRRDGFRRLMVIPPLVERRRVAWAAGEDPARLKRRVEVWCPAHVRARRGGREVGVNTHSIRYAAITHLVVEKKAAPQIVAKVTGHKKLDYILHYTQYVRAEELLREVANE